MFVRVASTADLASGGMMAVKANGQNMALCHVEGAYYAISRQCGHEGAALEKGTLNGHIITCPLHFAQFDVRNGRALLGPCPRDYGLAEVPNIGRSSETKDLRTYLVKVQGEDILVDV